MNSFTASKEMCYKQKASNNETEDSELHYIPVVPLV